MSQDQTKTTKPDDYGDGYRAALLGESDDPSAPEIWREGWRDGRAAVERIAAGDYEELGDED